ncbi:MAG: ion transporter [Proteobacteria bacterium]|nr:ion transporter [Pseudomonadota bacterium]
MESLKKIAKKNHRLIYDLIMATLAFFSIVNLIPMALGKEGQPSYELAHYLDYFFCCIFFLEFVGSMYVTKNKTRYFFKQGWLDLLSSIPAIGVLRVARIARLVRLFRTFLRMRNLLPYLIQSKNVSTPVFLMIISFAVIFIAASLILQFEYGTGSPITTPLDAVWWSVVTMTTVGYGDMVPVSSAGRITAMVIMVCGVAFYGGVSGLLATYLMEVDDQGAEKAINQRLSAIEKKLNEIAKNLPKT